MLNQTEVQRLRSLVRKKENLEYQLQQVQEKKTKLLHFEEQLNNQLSDFAEEINSLNKKKEEE